jgi:hypothetical protein
LAVRCISTHLNRVYTKVYASSQWPTNPSIEEVEPVIRRCDDRDFESIWAIIHDGAQAYRGTIPEDRWAEPYMSREEIETSAVLADAKWWR